MKHARAKTLCICVAVCFGLAVGQAHAKGEAQYPTVAGVSKWEKVVDGLFTGTDKSGAQVRYYYGPAGAALQRDELRRELVAIDDSMVAWKKSAVPSGGSFAKQEKYADELASRIASLEDVIADAAGAKVTRWFYPLSGSTCGQYTMSPMTFTATNLPVDSPKAEVWQDYGNSTPAPPPPGPFAVLIETTAKVGHATNTALYNSDYDFSYTGAPIYSSATYNTLGGACVMQTTASIRTQCTAGAPWGFYSVTYDHTCARVLSNTAPTITP